MDGGPSFATLVRVILSVVAFPVTWAVISILTTATLQGTDTLQLQDNPQQTQIWSWLSTHQILFYLGVLALLQVIIWLAPLIRAVFPYYMKH